MIIDFLIDALIAGFLFACLSGPMGSIMVWRRLSFLGDTLSHAALLGIALASFTHLPYIIGIIAIAVVIIAVLVQSNDKKIGSDANLTILAHAALGVGLLALSFAPNLQQNYTIFLFGDILAVTKQDMMILGGVVSLCLAILIWQWRPILLTLISEELAISDGLPVLRYRLLLLAMMALFVSVCIQIFGALLITALLITPAASARVFAKSPSQMMIFSSLLAFTSICGGLAASALYDLPTTAAIVTTAFLIFILVHVPSFFKRRG